MPTGLSQATKSFLKDQLWTIPTPIARLMVGAACSANLLSRSYQAYFAIGRPTMILAGPFEGMIYHPVAAGSAWMPKLMGTYERELHPQIEQICDEPCDLVVDVGSAEGYYAIGLARRLPGAKVHGFDTDANVARLLARNAALNGVADRVIPEGFCSATALDALLRGSKSPLVVSDCEGFEVELLDPDAAPELRRARMIVEIHDYRDDDAITRKLLERFEATHEIALAPIQGRVRGDLPEPYRTTFSDEDAAAAMDESRPWPVGNWMVLRPRSVVAGTPV